MNCTESALVFDCRGDSLVGIIATPEQPTGSTGVVIVVGGPQYRAGSHRQFVHLSRALAAAGIPCLRFDYRGMGDSTGAARDFTAIDDDIRAAVDTLQARTPGVTRVVLWGLCDGASAAGFHAAADPRISGLVLLNPWVHTEEAEARVYLKNYYLRRVVSGAFWRKVLQGEFDMGRGLRGFWQMVRKVLPGARASSGDVPGADLPLPERLFQSLAHRPVKTLIVLSERDFVANEFEGLIREDTKWRRLMDATDVLRVPGADHTFSDPAHADQINRATVAWVRSL